MSCLLPPEAPVNTIVIRRKVDSDTLHIPELQSMIGREVEIIVRQASATELDDIDPQAFWKGKTLDELAAEQGVGPYKFSENLGHFTEEDFEGFDEALREWRSEGRKKGI
jgi:hypothetical protein